MSLAPELYYQTRICLHKSQWPLNGYSRIRPRLRQLPSSDPNKQQFITCWPSCLPWITIKRKNERQRWTEHGQSSIRLHRKIMYLRGNFSKNQNSEKLCRLLNVQISDRHFVYYILNIIAFLTGEACSTCTAVRVSVVCLYVITKSVTGIWSTRLSLRLMSSTKATYLLKQENKTNN